MHGELCGKHVQVGIVFGRDIALYERVELLLAALSV